MWGTWISLYYYFPNTSNRDALIKPLQKQYLWLHKVIQNNWHKVAQENREIIVCGDINMFSQGSYTSCECPISVNVNSLSKQ